MENDPKSSIYGVILRMRKMTLNRAYAPMFSHPDSEDLFGIKSRDERKDGWMSGLMLTRKKKREESGREESGKEVRRKERREVDQK